MRSNPLQPASWFSPTAWPNAKVSAATWFAIFFVNSEWVPASCRPEEIKRLSATSKMITGEMLRHMGEIIEVMTSGGSTTGVYSRAGSRETSGRANVFEAVG